MSRYLISVVILWSALSAQVQARSSDYVSSSLGYSSESFGWIAADDAANVTKAKEFSVDSLKAATFFLNLREKNDVGVVGVYEGSFSRYFSGDTQESMYDSSGETFERQSNARGQGFSNAIGFGAEMLFSEKRFSVTPLLGYVLNRQRYDLNDGNQIIDTTATPTPPGPIDSLDSRYEARWKGGWVGVDMAYTWASQFSLSGKLRYYDLRYSAVADWDQQSATPTSSIHTATGAGTAVMLEMGYQYERNMAFILNVQFSDWSADAGDAIDYSTDGIAGATNPLNDIKWESNTVLFGVRSHF